MAKKNQKFSAEQFGAEKTPEVKEAFYFGKENYKFMMIGLALIVLGFVLMMGADANTVNGKFDPNSWNEDIFSFRRVRLAPFLVIAGFAVEAYAILKRNKK